MDGGARPTLRLALGLLALGALQGLGPVGCGAQQLNPLSGQGLPPYEGRTNSAEDSLTTNVTVDVRLVKLLEIDEQKYTFTAVIDFIVRWDNPEWQRVSSFWNNKTFDGRREMEEVKECKRPCFTYGAADKARDPWDACCDGLWIPEIQLRNLIAMPDDRVVFDRLMPVKLSRPWLPGLESQPRKGRHINVGTVREVRMLGTFTSPLRFQSYPFDTQQLLIQLEPDRKFSIRMRGFNNGTMAESKYYEIVPGSTASMADYKTGENHEFQVETSDQLAGWKITNSSFHCTHVDAANPEYRKVLEGASHQASAGEPQRAEWAALGFQPFDRVGVVTTTYQFCAVAIKAQRLSVTATVTNLLPVAFIAVLSFVPLFAPPNELEMRVNILITLLLALTAVQFVFRSMLPLTSYVTKLDAFITLSYCLILAIVFESGVVYYMSTFQEHREKKGSTWIFQTMKPKKTGNTTTTATTTGVGNQDSDLAADEAPKKSTKDAPSFLSIFTRIKSDPVYAYRKACQLNFVAACVLFVAYVICSSLVLYA